MRLTILAGLTVGVSLAFQLMYGLPARNKEVRRQALFACT
jgi:hypothetical protein